MAPPPCSSSVPRLLMLMLASRLMRSNRRTALGKSTWVAGYNAIGTSRSWHSDRPPRLCHRQVDVLDGDGGHRQQAIGRCGAIVGDPVVVGPLAVVDEPD